MKKETFAIVALGSTRRFLVMLGMVAFFFLGAATTASAQLADPGDALVLVEHAKNSKKANFTGKVNDSAEVQSVTESVMAYKTSLAFMDRTSFHLKEPNATTEGALQSAYDDLAPYYDTADRPISYVDDAKAELETLLTIDN